MGSNDSWSNGLIAYTNNYVNIYKGDELLYTLTNFIPCITISSMCNNNYVYANIQNF